MGRQETEIAPELLQQAEENPEQQEEIAVQAGVSKKTLKQRIKKVNLQTSFVADAGDKGISGEIDASNIGNEDKNTLEPAQYDAVAMAAIMLMDGMGLMMKNIGNMLLKSKGKELNYDVLSETEKNFMVTQLKSQPDALNYLAQNDFMMPVLAFGSIIATFVMHFKIKDVEKEENKGKNGNNSGNNSSKIVSNGNNSGNNSDFKGNNSQKSIDKKLQEIKLNIKTRELSKINSHPDARLESKVDFLD